MNFLQEMHKPVVDSGGSNGGVMGVCLYLDLCCDPEGLRPEFGQVQLQGMPFYE